MKYEDTVMSNTTKRQFRIITTKPRFDYWNIEKALELQAKITFDKVNTHYEWQEEHHSHEKQRIMEIVTEDFVEVVANFYMNEENRNRTFALWDDVKRQILEESDK